MNTTKKFQTLGADPEVFVRLVSTGDIIPSTGLLGGAKGAPFMVDEFIGLQEDNVMAEFNIKPSVSAADFSDNIQKGLLALDSKLGNDFSFEILPSHTFEPYMLTDPKAIEFGCDPDFNAYTRTKNPTIGPANVGNLRACGGHIHIGYEGVDEDFNFELVKMLDLYLGIPAVLMDDDINRRQFYGKAGALRHKVYGLEYRSLSSFWLRTKEATEWVYNQSTAAFDSLLEHGSLSDSLQKTIQQAINTVDKKTAQDIVSEYKFELV